MVEFIRDLLVVNPRILARVVRQHVLVQQLIEPGMRCYTLSIKLTLKPIQHFLMNGSQLILLKIRTA